MELKRLRVPVNGDLAKEYSVRSFVVREITGEDEELIGVWLDGRRGNDLISVAQAEQRAKEVRSLVEVDGNPVNATPEPYSVRKWNVRTLQLLAAAYRRLNGMTESDLKAAFGEEKTAPTAPSPAGADPARRTSTNGASSGA